MTFKNLFLFVLLVLMIYPKIGQAQDTELIWATSIGGQSQDFVYATTIDQQDHIITTGFFIGTVDFDPRVTTFELESLGAQDIYIHKATQNGDLIWVKQIGGIGFETPDDVAVDSEGNIYVSGRFVNEIDFDPGPDTFILDVNVLTHFLLKLDSDGNFQWVVIPNQTEGGLPSSLIINEENNIYLGSIKNGNQNTEIQQYNSDGVLQWDVVLSGEITIKSITLNADNEIFVGGNFFGNVDFDPDSDQGEVETEIECAFILHLDADGQFNWVRGFVNDSGWIRIEEITIDSQSNVYGTGNFSSTVDFDPSNEVSEATSNGGTDIFVSKLNSSGEFIWNRTFGGPEDDLGWKIEIDSQDNVLSGGTFKGTVDFDPGASEDLITFNGGAWDTFLHKIHNDGTYQWVRAIGGSSAESVLDINVDSQNDIVLSGIYRGTVDFGDQPNSQILEAQGVDDIFTAKILDNNILDLEDETSYKGVIIYPNPSNGVFSLDLGRNYEQIEINLTDASGRVILSQEFTNSQRIELNPSTASGIYFLKVNTAGLQKTYRLVRN